MSWIPLGLALAVGGVIGLVLEPACCDLCVGPTVVFICDPQERPRADRCPETHSCCSDDPTTASGAVPSYKGKDIDGAPPLFAAANNDVSGFGMCVRTSDIPADAGLHETAASGCPIPCNPTWSELDVSLVCGVDRECCQTIELDADDCVRDEDTGLWRPADGRDALASLDGGTRWDPTSSSTHQDPQLDACAAHAGSRNGEVFRSCVAQLTTANQRGFCMALGPAQLCPAEGDSSSYRSACDEMND